MAPENLESSATDEEYFVAADLIALQGRFGRSRMREKLDNNGFVETTRVPMIAQNKRGQEDAARIKQSE